MRSITGRPGYKHVLVGLALGVFALGANCTNGDGTTPTTTEEPPVRTIVDPTNPSGSVAGTIFDFALGTPLQGVTVTLLAGAHKQEATTDADGAFTFSAVPAGGLVRVVMKKTDYHTAQLDVPLDDAAGNFPTGTSHAFVGPVSMLNYGTTALRANVILPDGQPASGVQVFMDLGVAFTIAGDDERPVTRGNIHVMVQADTEGNAIFLQMPDPAALYTRFPTMNVTLTVGSYGGTAEVPPRALGTTQQVSLQTLVTNRNQVTVVLPEFIAGEPLTVLASNLVDLISNRVTLYPGLVAPSPADGDSLLRVVFNRPIELATVEALIVGEEGAPLDPNGNITRMSLAGTATEGAVATIDLILPRAIGGTEANMLLHASPSGGGTVLERAAPVYFTADQPLAIANLRQLNSAVADAALGANEQAELALNQAVGGRSADGTAAAGGAFLPILVTMSQPGITVKMNATLAEPDPRPPYRAGGYTTRLRFTMPADTPVAGFSPQAATVRVDFNDAARRDGGLSAGGGLTATLPDGTPVDTVNGSPLVNLLASEQNSGTDAGL